LLKAPNTFIPEIFFTTPYFSIIDGGDFAEENVDTQPLGRKVKCLEKRRPGEDAQKHG
jgi:hypothetical protein